MPSDKTPLKVTLSGAAGQIAYSLLPFIINGDIFGKSQKIDLRLLDITPMLKKLNGVVMELEDSSSPVLERICATDDQKKAFDQVEYAILVGGFPRREGMKRADLLDKNRAIFSSAGKSLAENARKGVKVLVVANPANTNALVLQLSSAKTQNPLMKENISALTRLDQNRAVGLLARQHEVSRECVSDVVIWGNHSSTQVPDINAAKINGKCIKTLENNGMEITEADFIKQVQTRGAAVISARGLSSALSAACAIRDHLHDWHFGTAKRVVSMAVSSCGNPFGVREGLFFSFPVRITSDGKWEFASDSEFLEGVKSKAALIALTEKELKDDREKVE